ncbi:hypothetical protein [Massilia sp. KIM]|uniref:hypothetical protein n=1 Tax=Massilia sp. KIM TaxID=1955422 RepID=UPI00117DAD60|nr:hypothetical protein [Massilia sp. KIM]
MQTLVAMDTNRIAATQGSLLHRLITQSPAFWKTKTSSAVDKLMYIHRIKCAESLVSKRFRFLSKFRAS